MTVRMERVWMRSIFCAALLVGLAATGRAQGGPPGDPLGPDVFGAVTKNDVVQLQLLLDKGAKPEAVNWLGITPLLWAGFIGNESAANALIQRKANINVDTIFGGSLETAVMGGNPKLVKTLLNKGAAFTKIRGDMLTATMMAAEAGHNEILAALLAKKPDVNAADIFGMTALMHATRRGQAEAARLLFTAGAKAEVADMLGRTPLMYAAMNGHADTVNLLLKNGAQPNVKDKVGNTALILAAKYSGNAALAAALVKAGGDATIRDTHGRIPAEIAQSRGYPAFAAVTRPNGATLAGFAAEEKPLAQRARQAVQLSLPLIEKTTGAFSEKVPCASCHHQGLGLATTGMAKRYGYLIDEVLAQNQQKIVLGEANAHIEDLRKLIPHPEMYKHFPTVDMSEFSPGVSSTFAGLIQHNAPRTEATDAMATILARQQMPNGGWGFYLHREPIQSSWFMTTAYSIRALKNYLPESLAKERDQRIARALTWLKATPAKNSEDQTFRLLALKWAGAAKSDIDIAVMEICSKQRADGGWAQFFTASPAGPGYAHSDAYATGESLYALYEGGGIDPATDGAYTRGVEYLLRTQDEDGSWFVNKRATPVNNFMDTGFPHGESQYISYGATCFATMSLMIAADAARPPAQTASDEGVKF